MRSERLASAALSAVGPILMLVGIALTSGIGVAIVIGLGLVALAVVSVISRRRRRRDVASSSPSEQQEAARNSYRIMRWSQVVILAAVLVFAVVLVVVGGVSLGTGLMLAGLAISTVLAFGLTGMCWRSSKSEAAVATTSRRSADGQPISRRQMTRLTPLRTRNNSADNPGRLASDGAKRFDPASLGELQPDSVPRLCEEHGLDHPMLHMVGKPES